TVVPSPAPPGAITTAPPRRRRWRSAAAVITAAAIFVVGGVAAVVYLIRPARGTVVVQPADAAAAAPIRTARIQLTGDGGPTHPLDSPERSRDLPAGSSLVTTTGAEGVTADPDRVEVRRGETAVVRMTFTLSVVRPMPPSSDPERKAAEWARGLGGTVELL